jgi:hypothetical protein
MGLDSGYFERIRRARLGSSLSTMHKSSRAEAQRRRQALLSAISSAGPEERDHERVSQANPTLHV